MIPAWLLAAALGGDQPRILAVGAEKLDGRPAVRLLSAGPLREVGLAREGAYLVLTVRAEAPAQLPPPAPQPPLTSIRFQRARGGFAVLMGVAPDVPYEVRRQEATLTILFGEPPGRPIAESAPPPVPAVIRLAAAAPPEPAQPSLAARNSEAALYEPRPSPPVAATPVPTPALAPAPSPTPIPAPAPSPTPGPLSTAAAAAALFPGAAAAKTPGESEPASDARSLYARIFPAPADLPPEMESGAQPEAARSTDDGRAGLALGPLRVRPQGDVVYVNAETTLETATPVRDDYFEFRPRIAADTPLGAAQLEADYEARLRRGSAFDLVGSTTHLANASLSVPISLLQTRAAAHFARGVLETTEVDPGREYFFKLGHFTHKSLELSLRTTTGSRFDLEGSLGLDMADLAADAGFVSHDTWRASAGLRYELTPNAHASLAYAYGRVPQPADRPEAASRSDGGVLTLAGELAPLLEVAVSLGYQRRETPQAGTGGRSYRGMTVDGRVRKAFSRASTIVLGMSRDTQVSAFESNGFYVSTAVRAEVGLPLPFAVAFRGGAEYRWNGYQTVASEIGEPRRDRLFGWALGVGRPLTRWSYVRADYRHDRRRSNLSRLDTDLDGFTIQIGFGVFAENRP